MESTENLVNEIGKKVKVFVHKNDGFYNIKKSNIIEGTVIYGDYLLPYLVETEENGVKKSRYFFPDSTYEVIE